MGWFANPVFGNGDYPQLLKDIMNKVKVNFGLPNCPLPEFTEEEKRLNKGNNILLTIFVNTVVALEYCD